MKNLLTILLLSYCCMLPAQHPYFYKLDSENGFPSNEVYQLAQDTFGFIWIGCDAGIFRYDGIQFKQYVHPKQNARSISQLIIDEEQRVWCQNFAGQIFYIQDDSIHLFRDFSKEIRSFPTYTVDSQQLLVTAKNGIKIIDINTQRVVKTVQNQYDETTFIVDEILREGLGLYVNARDNIFYKNENNTFSQLFQSKMDCLKMFEYDQGIYALIRLGTTSKWQIIALQGNQFQVVKTLNPPSTDALVYMVKPVKDGFICCTSKGVLLLDKYFEVQQHLLSNEKIADALFDKEGNFWLTSLQNGIYIIPSLDIQLYQKDFFENTNMTALFSQNNQLWIGTYSGDIYEFDTRQRDYRRLDFPMLAPWQVIRSMAQSDEYLIISKAKKTLLINKKTKKRRYLEFTNIRSMYIYQDSALLLNSRVAGMMNLQTGEIRKILDGSGRAVTKHPTQVIYYLATKHGFFKYENGHARPILKDGSVVFPTAFDWQEDTLWLGTLSNGILAYHNGQFLKSLLPNSSIRTICIEGHQLIVATSEGLVKMDLMTQRKTTIDPTDGLHQQEIAAIEVINNQVYLATTKGLITFPLEKKAENTYSPRLAITKVFLNDSLPISTDYQLFRHNENNLTIHFQTALFRSRGDYYYEYRLLGLSEQWLKTGSDFPFATYRLLGAGTYSFEVRAVNEDGVKSDIQTFSFKIERPIWERWWFWALIILLLSIIVYSWVSHRIRTIRRQATLENELKSLQLTALKAQMNPHFLYNALNSIRVLILQKEVRKASKYLTKFSHLMRQILEASGATQIALSDEVNMLELYLTLEKLRFGNDFEYQIKIVDDLDITTFYIPSMIVQPFVENAVKHGLLHKMDGKKKLNITFDIQELVVCTIEDNGVGRVKAKEIQTRQGQRKTSFATSATQKRLEILNQRHQSKIGLDIDDLYKNDKAIGTKVVLRIPLLR